MGKKTYFSNLWINDKTYSLWLQRGTRNTTFFCKLCKKERELAAMGEGALISHAEGDKHRGLVAAHNAKVAFFSPKHTNSDTFISTTEVQRPSCSKDELSSSSVLSPTSSKIQVPVFAAILGGTKTEAEIRWILYCIKHNFSDNSMTNFLDTMQAMFPDSTIAKQMTLSPMKIKIFTNHGLYIHFRDILLEEVLSSPYVVVCFDESLNHMTQNCQMDINIKFWDVVELRVQERYWHSSFLGKSAATDLLEHFENALEKVDLTKLIQVSMDGPSVNWLFLQKLMDKRKENGLSGLINIGCCNLHIIHGAFKTGTNATTWKIKDTLKGSFQMLHDTPARRQDYSNITGDTVYPMFFCGTRWVEDKPVADRLIGIWPNIIKLIDYYEGLPKSKRPSSKSYINVKTATNDILTVAKLLGFSYIASLLLPILTIYQKDCPMLPFLFLDLKNILKVLLSIVVKPTILEKTKKASEMLKIDLSDENNLINAGDIYIGSAVEQEINKHLKADSITKKDARDFKDNAQKLITNMVSKLAERSPIGSVIVRNALVFHPNIMVTYAQENLIGKLKVLTQTFVELEFLKFKVADGALMQYRDFMNKEVKLSKEKFIEFDGEKERLDDFFFIKMKVLDSYPDLANVLIIVLIISTGQSSVERGFSTNKPLLKVNMKEDTVVARRLIKGYLTSKSVNPHSINITSSMIKHVKAANMRYHNHLEEEKKKTKESDSGVEKVRIINEIKCITEQSDNLKKTIDSLNVKFVKLTKKAEEKYEMKYLIEGNALKRKADEKTESLEVLIRRKDELLSQKQKLS